MRSMQRERLLPELIGLVGPAGAERGGRPARVGAAEIRIALHRFLVLRDGLVELAGAGQLLRRARTRAPPRVTPP